MVRTLFDRLFTPERASRGAILYEHREITYSELRDETIRVAEVLHGLDIQVGDRVAILLADSPEFITSFVAIISLGAIAVPINLALRREDQLSHSEGLWSARCDHRSVVDAGPDW